MIHEVRPEKHLLAASWNLEPEGSRLYQKYYGLVDVWAMRGRSKCINEVCISESLCPSRELVGTEFFNDFLSKQRIAHGLFGFIENDPLRRCGSVSLYRGPSLGEFDVSDVETLRSLTPHFKRAFMLHSQFSKLKARTASIETALNMLAVGVILIGPNHEVVLINRKATELLQHGDGLQLIHGRLSTTLQAEAARLHTMISEAAKTGSENVGTGGTLFVSRSSGGALSVTAAPLGKFALGLCDRAAAVLFICDPDRGIEVPANLLQRGYGLTSAEARLTGILLEGRSLKDAADFCKVTHNTAKSQLKSVFSKTHVRRQSELIKLLLTVSAPLSGPPH